MNSGQTARPSAIVLSPVLLFRLTVTIKVLYIDPVLYFYSDYAVSLIILAYIPIYPNYCQEFDFETNVYALIFNIHKRFVLYIDLAIIYIVQWWHHREGLVEIKSLLQYNKEIIQLNIF
ncbi:hypothetical protein ALC53_05658 [Atta colombica]|uniref:Uncharacterized protein n=1 Tax=Atta colombica TaxID=520822 RepID=A0A151I494_9HYME|nr:hypothetical protein ALC53_05658 [Atta colombica]